MIKLQKYLTVTLIPLDEKRLIYRSVTDASKFKRKNLFLVLGLVDIMAFKNLQHL